MSGKKILVVDDDADIVEYVSALLEDNGYEVRGAARSLDALEILNTFAPDVVIIDVLMPGQSGLDLMVRIRKDRRWRAIPVVMLTGNDEVLQDGGKSYVSTHDGIRGADELLGKPLDPGALFGALERVCTGASSHEPASDG